MKKEHQLISKVKGALTYPAVILVAMGGIGTFMMIVVVPKITLMFRDMQAELPLPTKVLMMVSDAIVNNGILVGVGFVIFVASFIQILKTKNLSKLIDYIISKHFSLSSSNVSQESPGASPSSTHA